MNDGNGNVITVKGLLLDSDGNRYLNHGAGSLLVTLLQWNQCGARGMNMSIIRE